MWDIDERKPMAGKKTEKEHFSAISVSNFLYSIYILKKRKKKSRKKISSILK